MAARILTAETRIWVLDNDESGERHLFISPAAATTWAKDVDEDHENVPGLVRIAWRQDSNHIEDGEHIYADLIGYDGGTIGSIWGQKVEGL